MPNFLVIGAARCGTTSLYHYLKQHPQIFVSPVKETEFFCFDGERPDWSGPRDQAILDTCVTELDAYVALFQDARDELAVGDVSRWYIFSDRAPERIRHYIPQCKMIAMLRNPAERAWSHFQFQCGNNLEPIRDFATAIAEEENRMRNGWGWIWAYVRRGFYYQQLRRYFSLFDRKQLLVCLYDDFRKHPSMTLSEIFRFLEVDHELVVDATRRHAESPGIPRLRILHRILSPRTRLKKLVKTLLPEAVVDTARQVRKANLVHPQLPVALRQQLIDTYRDDILKLGELLDRDLSMWLSCDPTGPE